MTMHYIQHSKVILSYLEIWCTIKGGLISESFSLSQKVCQISILTSIDLKRNGILLPKLF